jgi:hypothetical protein
MNRNLFDFNLLLGFSALFIAGCAAFFSIWGIGLLFSGASIAAMVMASSLELGKLVATSFLYRFWKKSQWLLKSYLCGAVFILMLITSLGIFGYLTSAYQQSSIKYTMMLDSIKLLEDQKKQEQSKISEVKLRIDSLSALRKTQESRLSEINTNSLLARNPIQFRQVQDQTMELIDQTDKNIKVENDKSSVYSTVIDSIDKKVAELKLNTASNKDIQTFKFVADELNMNLNTVVKWFILILIFVFDPLAVALILAYNMSISKEYAIYTVDDKKEKPNVVEKPKMEEPKVEKPNVVEEPPKNVVTNTVSEQSITPTEEITQIVEKYDTNNDGKIDEIESTNITKEELKKMDNQGDDFFKRYFTQR